MECLRCAGAPSDLNQLKCRVEALKLDAGIAGCKAPVSFDIVGVAVEEPGVNMALEAAPVRNAPIETLIAQHGEQDNLNTHNPASLYEAFTALEARRLVERFEWHYTPKLEGLREVKVTERRTTIDYAQVLTRYDYEYQRNGTASLFMLFAPRDQLTQSLPFFAAEFDDEFLVHHVAPPCRILGDSSRISVRNEMQ
jgi:hypothetical protein